MKKLEDIGKKEIFTVPDKYFDELPGIIQARISPAPQRQIAYGWKWAVAVSMACLLVAGIFVFWPTTQQQSPDQILAAVPTQDLILYITNSDITTEELLDYLDLAADDISGIEDASLEDIHGADLEEWVQEFEITSDTVNPI